MDFTTMVKGDEKLLNEKGLLLAIRALSGNKRWLPKTQVGHSSVEVIQLELRPLLNSGKSLSPKENHESGEATRRSGQLEKSDKAAKLWDKTQTKLAEIINKRHIMVPGGRGVYSRKEVLIEAIIANVKKPKK